MTVTFTQSQIPNKLPIRKQDSHEYLLAAIRTTRSWWVWQEALLSLGKTTWITRSDWRLLRFTWITNFTIMVNFKQGRPFNSILSVHTYVLPKVSFEVFVIQSADWRKLQFAVWYHPLVPQHFVPNSPDTYNNFLFLFRCCQKMDLDGL